MQQKYVIAPRQKGVLPEGYAHRGTRRKGLGLLAKSVGD